MDESRRVIPNVFGKTFDYQQPLSTFDLDDEILPDGIASTYIRDHSTLQNHSPLYPQHRRTSECFTIYEKGDEEKTFHNDELEKRSDICRSGLTNSTSFDVEDHNTETQDYYENLLFIKGESPRRSTAIAVEDRDNMYPTEETDDSDGYEDVTIEEAKYENQSVINAVDKAMKENRANDYENVEFVNGKLIPSTKKYEAEGMYAIGRRFPSFRVANRKKKKHLKKSKKLDMPYISGKRLSNSSTTSSDAEDSLYSKPRKWKFAYRRSDKNTKILSDSTDENSKNASNKR